MIYWKYFNSILKCIKVLIACKMYAKLNIDIVVHVLLLSILDDKKGNFQRTLKDYEYRVFVIYP